MLAAKIPMCALNSPALVVKKRTNFFRPITGSMDLVGDVQHLPNTRIVIPLATGWWFQT